MADREAGASAAPGHRDPYCPTHCSPGRKHSQCGCDCDHTEQANEASLAKRAPWPEPGTEGWTHLDNMSDEGAAYRQFHGWRLTCAWCEYAAEAKTKTEAVALMQGHYDRVCGVGNAYIGMGRVDG